MWGWQIKANIDKSSISLYLRLMKTTIELPDSIARQAKLLAAERQTSQALRYSCTLNSFWIPIFSSTQFPAPTRNSTSVRSQDIGLPWMESAYPLTPMTESVLWSGLQIKERYNFSYWDAAIIAAAMELGCHTLDSEDSNHGQTYAGIRVINPFGE
jgi:hypothetical protein